MTYFKDRFRKENQDFINFIVSSSGYILFVGILLFILHNENDPPYSIDTLDFFLILLATLRLTEFFVYDKSMQFVRDLFVDIKRIEIKKSEIEIKRTTPAYGLRRTMHDLLSCPWCTSIWTATLIIFIYFTFPTTWIFILILAISGGATIIQLATNMIGWTSEKTELEVEKEEDKTK